MRSSRETFFPGGIRVSPSTIPADCHPLITGLILIFSSNGQSVDLVIDSISDLLLCPGQIEVGLKIEPELGRNQKPAGSGDPAYNGRNVNRDVGRVTSRGGVNPRVG